MNSHELVTAKLFTARLNLQANRNPSQWDYIREGVYTDPNTAYELATKIRVAELYKRLREETK